MQYWLFKSEPSSFSIDQLIKSLHQTTNWNGVRNYQVRNMLRDEVKENDQVFFYHSGGTSPAIVGTMRVVKSAYPDNSALDKDSDYYDPKSSPSHPVWYQVDVKFVKKFSQPVTLAHLKNESVLKNMRVLQKGNRLSITPVTKEEWEYICQLATKL